MQMTPPITLVWKLRIQCETASKLCKILCVSSLALLASVLPSGRAHPVRSVVVLTRYYLLPQLSRSPFCPPRTLRHPPSNRPTRALLRFITIVIAIQVTSFSLVTAAIPRFRSTAASISTYGAKPLEDLDCIRATTNTPAALVSKQSNSSAFIDSALATGRTDANTIETTP